MTNDDTMLREVDQALAEDQTTTEFKKNLPFIIGAAVAVVAGVGGYQAWRTNATAAAEKASLAYQAAVEVGEGAEAEAKLEALAAGKGGYAIIARMQLAGEHASHGETDKALALYREVYSAGGGSKRVKDLARIRAASLAMASGRDAVIKDIGQLETDASPLGYYAREILALAALKANDVQTAETMFLKAASDLAAPEPVRERAREFAALATAAKSGVTLPTYAGSAKSDVEIMMEQLKDAGSDLSSVIAPAPAESAAPQPQANE